MKIRYQNENQIHFSTTFSTISIRPAEHAQLNNLLLNGKLFVTETRCNCLIHSSQLLFDELKRQHLQITKLLIHLHQQLDHSFE